MKMTVNARFVLLMAVIVVAGFAGETEAGWFRRAWRWIKENVRVRVTYTGRFSQNSACNSNIILRSVWLSDKSAVQPSGSTQPPGKFPVVYVTQAAENATCNSAASCVTAINKLRYDNIQGGYNDIRYAFVIGQDGEVYQGCGWSTVCVFDTIDNAPGNIGVAFVGSFLGGAPNQASLDAFKNLVKCGIDSNYILPNPQVDVPESVLETSINTIKW